jgi:hypothetical protein
MHAAFFHILINNIKSGLLNEVEMKILESKELSGTPRPLIPINCIYRSI